MQAKTKKTLIAAAAAVLALLIVFLAVTEVLMFTKMNDMSRRLSALMGEEGLDEAGETQENDVLIAGEYWIRPTTKISDAYKKGSDAGLSHDERETLEMASAVLEEIITDGMTDYEKEEAVFDWMVSHLGYDEGALTVVSTSTQEQANPHGVLKNHTAVCVGYATTFRLFMEMLDIPCMVVHNDERYHSWDLVQLDGNWYHVDVYSAIAGGGYKYLNLSDEILIQEENWDMEFYPGANSLDYNYSYRNAVRLDSVYDLPKALREAFAGGGDYWSFVFDGNDVEAQVMVSALESRSNDDNDVQDAWDEVSTYVNYSMFPMDDGTFLLIVNYYSDESDEEVFENVDYERIEQSITDAFGEGGISVRDIQNGN